MRASSCAARAAALPLVLAAALAAGAGAAGAQAAPAGLEPAFRLPAGGRAYAGPLVDSGREPSAAWLLSEDRSLYLLSEAGSLVARVPLPGKPAPWLALDPAGRILVAVEETGADGLPATSVRAYTRSGVEAFRLPLAGGAPRFAPAFGSDGRIFVLDGNALLCHGQAGRRLWRLELPAPPSAAPAVDGSGRPLLGLADGRILSLSPYGEILSTLEAGSPALALSAFGAAPGGGGGGGGSSFMPSAAAGLRDGRLILLGGEGAPPALGSPVAALASDTAVLYALSENGRLAAVAGSGVALWSVETGVRSGALELYRERVLVTGKGRAVSLSHRGEILREASIRNAAARGVPSPAGLLYSPGEDWVLAAYRFERELGRPFRPPPAPYTRRRDAVIEALAYDPAIADSSRQLLLLADIEKSLESGTIGAGEEGAAALAAAIALGEFDPSWPQSERRFRGNPLPRARACGVLGLIGSVEDREVLLRVLESDADPSVRAAACDALGEIAADPDGLAGAAFLAVARKVDPPLDDRVAYALIGAMERMALRSGRPPSAEGVRALLALAAKPFGSAIRDRASRALGRIAGALGP